MFSLWSMMRRWAAAGFLAAALVSACASGGATSSAQVQCAKDADCRLFSDYCDGCACRALAVGAAEPTCKGRIVQCLVDPCQGKQAVCSTGSCAAAP